MYNLYSMTELAISSFEHTDKTLSDADVTVSDVTLREQLWMSPSLVWLRSKENKAAALTITAVDEILDKPSLPLGMGMAVPVASAAVLGITQVLDRARIVVKEAPPRAIDTMVDMDFSKPSTLVAASIVAGSFAVWNFAAGEVVNRTIEQFPRTTEKFIETFPRVVKAAEYGIPQEIQEFNQQRAQSETPLKKSRLTNKLKRGLKRGTSGAFSFGSTIYIGVSTVNGIPANQRTKINAEVSRDGAILGMLPVTAAVAEVVRRSVVNGDPETAATVLSWVQDKSNWNWVAGGVMAATVGSNYLARRKIKDQDLETAPTAEGSVNPTS